MSAGARPSTLHDLHNSGWTSRSVKEEIRTSFFRMLHKGEGPLQRERRQSYGSVDSCHS